MKRDPLTLYRRKLLGLSVSESEIAAIEEESSGGRHSYGGRAQVAPPALELAFTQMWSNGGFEWRN